MAGTDALPTDYEALRSGAAWRVVPRDVLRVEGEDAPSYLQGQCSQDVEGLEVGASTEALVLSPQGRVDALVRVTREGPTGFVLDTEGGAGPTVRERLLRFRLRVRVEVEPVPWTCLALRGPAWAEVRDSAAVAVGAAGGPVLSLPALGPGPDGCDLVGPAPMGPPPYGWVGPSAVAAGDAVWEAVRIESGLPRIGREITEATIPAEAELVDRTVSFTKGCFTGQELVARLDARGSNVARRLCGVVLDGAADEAAVAGLEGTTVTTADAEHEVGTLTSVAWSPGLRRVVALATLRRRVVPPEAVLVAGPAGPVTAEARPLPLWPAA